jgi:hypothetical protein
MEVEDNVHYRGFTSTVEALDPENALRRQGALAILKSHAPGFKLGCAKKPVCIVVMPSFWVDGLLDICECWLRIVVFPDLFDYFGVAIL